MNGEGSKHHEEIGAFQIVVLILSIVVLGALFVDTAFKLPEQISGVLQIVDTLVCFLLIVDFGIRFYKAKSKLEFMKWGWIDLLASVPNLPWLRYGRLIRILRIIRLLRAIRATQKVTAVLLRNRFQGSIASIFVTAFLIVMFSSIGILICEQSDPKANIKTAGDALWWSVATITTVGYGDVYPVTAEGRCLAMVLMVTGVGIFGILSGLLASVFIGAKNKKTNEDREILERLKRLEEKIDNLRGDAPIND